MTDEQVIDDDLDALIYDIRMEIAAGVDIDETFREIAINVLRAIDAAGWQCVPKEPTEGFEIVDGHPVEGMTHCGANALYEAMQKGLPGLDAAATCYRAMIDAAPKLEKADD